MISSIWTAFKQDKTCQILLGWQQWKSVKAIQHNIRTYNINKKRRQKSFSNLAGNNVWNHMPLSDTTPLSVRLSDQVSLWNPLFLLNMRSLYQYSPVRTYFSGYVFLRISCCFLHYSRPVTYSTATNCLECLFGNGMPLRAEFNYDGKHLFVFLSPDRFTRSLHRRQGREREYKYQLMLKTAFFPLPTARI